METIGPIGMLYTPVTYYLGNWSPREGQHSTEENGEKPHKQILAGSGPKACSTNEPRWMPVTIWTNHRENTRAVSKECG